MQSAILPIIILCISAPGEVNMPAGYQLVDASRSDLYHEDGRINNCGEIVFSAFTEDSPSATELFHYDNGRIVRLTFDDDNDSLSDINEDGVIVWTDGFGVNDAEHILVLEDNQITDLGAGLEPVVNSAGQIAWEHLYGTSCAAEATIYLYDEGKVVSYIDSALSDQSPAINDYGTIAWTRYDFCASPWWTSDIMIKLYDSVVTELTDEEESSQSVEINNYGTVVWSHTYGITVWDTGVSWLLTDWGEAPAINDAGHIYFNRNTAGLGWQPWLYRDGVFYRLVDELSSNWTGDMNEDGEVAWSWYSNNPDNYEAGTRYLRRIRNGDVVLDSIVNELDYAAMPDCLTGPGDYDRLCDCRFYDIGHDRDVDLADFATFQNHFGRQVYYYGDGTWGFDPPPPPPPSTCCSTGHGPGCDDEDGEACVCAALPACCLADWTDACVALYEAACGGICD